MKSRSGIKQLLKADPQWHQIYPDMDDEFYVATLSKSPPIRLQPVACHHCFLLSRPRYALLRVQRSAANNHKLRSSSIASSDDTETLRLMRPVLNLLDDAFTRGLNSIRDVELLQDFILNVSAVLIIRFTILKTSFSRHSAMVV